MTIASPPEYISDSRSPSRAGSSIISKYLLFTTLRREERNTSPSKWPRMTPPRLERLNSQPLRICATPRRLRKYQRRCSPLMPLRSLAIVNARKTPPETLEATRCSAGWPNLPKKGRGVLLCLELSPPTAGSRRPNEGKTILPSLTTVALPLLPADGVR